MWVYLLKSTACLVAFFAFYKLFLEKQNMHVFKRFYLLGVLLISFGIPFITFVEYIEVTQELFILPADTIFMEAVEQPVPEPVNYCPTILWSVYFLGAALFGIRFIANFGKLIYKIQRNPKIKQANHTNVLLQPKITPHTFFEYVFLNKKAFENHKIPQEVILHEAAHAKQKHSIDVVFIEFLQAIFWFNPLLYMLKKAIKLNHEFLADQAVLENGVSLPTYQELLLALSSNANHPQLANAINYSSFKKRFTVMKTQTTTKAIWLRSLLLLPLLAVLIFSFSTKEIVEKENPIAKSTTIQDTYPPEASEKMMEEYRNFIKEFEKNNVVYQPKYNRIVAIYSLMSASQKASVKKYPPVPPTNLATIKRKTPSQEEFNFWKDKNKFAIWIDGKHVPNSTLNNYKPSDIVYYSGSFVYNNARSKKFPQEYQYNLYTSKGFDQTYLKSNVNKYNAIKKQYQEALKSNNQDEIQILKTRLQSVYEIISKEQKKKYNIKPINNTNLKQDIKQYNIKNKEYESLRSKKPHYKDKSKKEQEKLDRLFSDLGGMYFRLSVVNKQKVNRPKHPYTPYVKIEKNGKVYFKKKEELTEEEKKLLPPPPPPARKNMTSYNIQEVASAKDITEYNRIAKKCNKALKGNPQKDGSLLVVKEKEINKMKAIYKKMSKKQKEDAEPFPKLPEFVKTVLSKKKSDTKSSKITQDRKELPEVIEVIEKPSSKHKTENKNLQEVIEIEEVPEIIEVVEVSEEIIEEPIPQEQKTGYIEIKGEIHYYVKKGKQITYYNRWGQKVDKKGNVLSTKQTKATDVIHGQVISKVYKDGKVVSEFDDSNVNIPPPPPPMSPLEHAKKMAKKGAEFYFNKKLITSKEDIEILKKNPEINILTKTKNVKRPIVRLSTLPIVIEVEKSSNKNNQ
jgi:hypothetical protein